MESIVRTLSFTFISFNIKGIAIISLEVRGEVQGKTRYYISDEKEESA